MSPGNRPARPLAAVRRICAKGTRRPLSSPLIGGRNPYWMAHCDYCEDRDFVVIGVGGPYGSGKTTLATSLAAGLGFAHVEVDHLGHAALQTMAKQVIAAFGPGIVGPDGTIDRRALGKIVFGNEAARLRLEAILHPCMKQNLVDQLTALRTAASQSVTAPAGAIISAALLYYMHLDEVCDGVIWITAPFLTRRRWIQNRDQLSTNDISVRLRAQNGLLPKAKRATADILRVENRTSRRTLRCLIGIMEHGTWIKNGL